MSNEPKADAVLETSGLLCPGPVVETSKAISGRVQIGQVLQVVSTDPGANLDIPAWCRNVGHELVFASEDPEGTFRFWIRRKQ
ncbi:MAG: sulfurtransferase TusA family protein [Actinobacteria bacterium]|jgi:TusA-related sulfurtransferase|nr:sulfurtransferase TusA family protein [Actinomycetota bacterium]MCL6095875.1 sulfurtransferase TusA family protein [Actinomycetota bacterium]